MSQALAEVETRGLGTNDVALVEKIFQRVMSQGSVLARRPAERARYTSNKTTGRNYRNDNFSNTTGARGGNISMYPSRSAGYTRSQPQSSPLGGHVGLYVAPGLLSGTGSQGDAENLTPFRYHRSARASARRQMALECGLKSLPVTAKWTPTGRSNMVLDNADQGPVIQNAVYLQAPEGNVNVRRGLSGSKVRQSVVTPRSGGQTPRSGSLPGSDHQDHHQHLQQQQQQAHHAFPQSAHHQHVSESVGYPISPSPRPQSRRLNSRESRAPLEREDENGLVRHYKWNLSEQGIRLQRQLSSLSSCRSIKRVSEIVSHRLDPMYLMSGSKVALQNRYGIDEQDMRRLHEMTQIREGLLSDLKKMKFPYGARAPKHVVQRTHKHRPPTDDTPRIDGNEQSKASLGAAKPAPVHPSTPASDPPDDPANQQQDRRPPSEQTNDEESGRAETE